jgi:hypothetical protein
MSPKLFLLRFLRRWHARIGFTAIVFFVILAVTGLVLNHGADLGLDAKQVHSAWLARWYGVEAESPRSAFRSPHHELAAANGRWLLDGRPAGEKLPEPVGLVELGDMVVAACASSLYVYRSDGRLVDRLEEGALPGVPVQAIGFDGGAVVLRTPSGIFASGDALSWRPARAQPVRWSSPAALSATERLAYAKALAPGISVQQLLLDVHSGRIAGRYGPLVVDLVGALLLVLAGSGAWLFLVPRRRKERH